MTVQNQAMIFLSLYAPFSESFVGFPVDGFPADVHVIGAVRVAADCETGCRWGDSLGRQPRSGHFGCLGQLKSGIIGHGFIPLQ